MLISMQKARKRKKKKPRAQTTCLSSFGPVFTVIQAGFLVQMVIYS